METAVAGPQGGPLIVLLHGFPDLWQGWHLLIGPLAENGFRVLAPNLRGYGRSDKPVGVLAYDLDVLAQDVRELVDSEGHDAFHLVGHDWGGMVAWWTAARFPDRVSRLTVLSAPHPGVFGRYLFRNPVQLLRSWYVGFFQIPYLPEALLRANHFRMLTRSLESTAPPGLFGEAEIESLREGWARPGSLTGMVNYYRAVFRRSRKSLQRAVTVPTVILTGSRDPTEEPGLATASRELCRHARVIVLEGVHHWPQREAPDRVLEEVLGV
ncbi:MAG TPA: alpha/beta hydrolase [Planctomycetaceae bacterium]|nr:alpha/beta hydrolase [Planctomycetaceae bacterium]